jgi:hypothetical protein
MKRNHLLAAFVVAFVAAVAAYWYWSPMLVVQRMQHAAEQSDVEAFSAHVDYAALRESFRAQVAAGMTRKMGDPRDNPFSAFGAMLGMAVAGPLIDVLVQPSTIAHAMRTGRLQPSLPAASAAAARDDDLTWTYERDGFDVVVAHPHHRGESADAPASAFVFVRRGFANWKLSEVRLAR